MTRRGAVRTDGLTKLRPGPDGVPTAVVDGVDLSVRGGEFVCVVGGSGCGKTTLLHLLCGLSRPSGGDVVVDGTSTLLFQEAALFPWLTAAGNVAVPLRLAGTGRAERRRSAAALLDLVGLDGRGGQRPHQLSGGQRQRVALARALARHADLLCMDEPFGALDAMTREQLQDELERVWTVRGPTVVFVTHDVTEAVRLADRVLLMDGPPGRVVGEVAVPLPRPRRLESPAVAGLAAEVADGLRAVRATAEGSAS